MAQLAANLATLDAGRGVEPQSQSVAASAEPQAKPAGVPDARLLRAGIVERLPENVSTILQTRICDLHLKIEGSPLERHVKRLYRELESRVPAYHPA